MAEPKIVTEEPLPQPWWEGKRAKKIAFFVGVPLLLWIMFRHTDPVQIQAPKTPYQVQQQAVTPKEIAQAQQQALQQAADIEAKKEQLEKTMRDAGNTAGVKMDDLDLTTPEGQAVLQNRIALANAVKAQKAGMPQTQPMGAQGYGNSGESRAEKARKSLLSSAVVFVKQDQASAAPNPGSPVANQAPQMQQPTPSESAKTEAKIDTNKPKSLLDLPPAVVDKLTQEGDYRVLPQGTVVEAVLTNKLVGDAAGPVNVMLTTPVYAPGTHEMIFPAGTRVLGEAASVEGFGTSRMAVAFHRSIINDGPYLYSVSLDTMPGLDQQGAVGLKGKINQHILSTIAISGVIGAIGGLANIGNYSGSIGSYGGMQQFQSGVSQYMGQSAMQVLNRFINRQPTVEIPPGTRVKLIWAADQNLPIYQDVIDLLED